jgi:hypothetical protein
MNEEKPKTFREFSLSNADRQSILDALKEEGFNEEQVDAMAPDRVWKLYVECMTENLSREFSRFARLYEENREFAPLIDPLIRNMNRQLENLADSLDRELNKTKKDEGKSQE